MIRSIERDRGRICETLLRSLPAWFGIEQSILDYVKYVEKLPTFVAEKDGETLGFISIEFHNPSTAEIHVMAVRASHHRQGVGRLLVARGERLARERGAEFFMVKTLGPSGESEEYGRTRQFYLGLGFRPLEELKNLWVGNPCLIMVRWLGPAKSTVL